MRFHSEKEGSIQKNEMQWVLKIYHIRACKPQELSIFAKKSVFFRHFTQLDNTQQYFQNAILFFWSD